jgi:general secretion pathway protein F/type IV pilus assembly protein PilC
MFGLSGTSLGTRSLLYTQLAQALDSGLAAASALRLLDRSGGDQKGAAAAAAIARGQTLVAAFDGSFGLPRSHRLALSASERAGRLPACLRQLSADLDAERVERREFWMSIAYPLLLMHAIVPATSITLLVTKPGLFAARVFGATALLWGAILAGIWFHRRGVRSRAYMHALQALPLVGPIVRDGAFVRYFRALVELYGSGVNFTEALEASRSVLGDAPPFDDFARASAAARGGAPMAAAFAALTSLDPLLRALLESAATTGDLENGLRRAIRDLEQRWRDATHRFLAVTSYGLYVLVACAVGWSVISFYAGMYSGLAENYDKHR